MRRYAIARDKDGTPQRLEWLGDTATLPGAPIRRPVRLGSRPSEKVLQAQCVTLLRSLGASVWVLGTRRAKGDYPGTRQTPGIGDVFALLPCSLGASAPGARCGERRALWLECKAEGGRFSQAQQQFRDACERTPGIGYVAGGPTELAAYLVAGGWLKDSACK